MSILFVGGSLVDFFADGTDNFADVTTTNVRDANYSRTELRHRTFENSSTPMSQEFSPTSDLWVHWRWRTPADIYSQFAKGHFHEVYNQNGNLLYRFDVIGTSSSESEIRLQVFGDSTVNSSTFLLPTNTTMVMDVRIEVGANIRASCYIGGSLAASATAANNQGKAASTSFHWINSDITDNPVDFDYFSEIIITDAEDTRGWRLATLTPNGQGFHSDFDGDWEELGDGSLATAAASGSNGDRVSSTVSAYGGLTTTTNVRGVFAKAIASRGDTGPANMAQFLRIGSVDYDAPAVAIGVNNTQTIAEWAVNPSTALPWSTADISSLQVGVKAET